MKTISKRILTVIIAHLIFIFTVCYYFLNLNNNAHADENGITYVKYDAQTGEYLDDDYTLYPLTSSVNSRALQGTDDRVVDFTKSGVVKLMTSDFYGGTGFVVDDHVIATAAHCVKDKQISEILLFDTNGNVDLRATPVESHFLKAYKELPTEENDYALITVEEDLSAYKCFDLTVPIRDLSESNCAISLTGFPQENNNQTQHTMQTGTGVVLYSDNTNLLKHSADSTGGNSGGPVYVTESNYGRIHYSVIAINTGGYLNSYNRGPQVNTNLLQFYMNNSELSY